jgi:hypothetical protein
LAPELAISVFTQYWGLGFNIEIDRLLLGRTNPTCNKSLKIPNLREITCHKTYVNCIILIINILSQNSAWWGEHFHFLCSLLQIVVWPFGHCVVCPFLIAAYLSSNPVHGEVFTIRPPRYNWNIVESGVKHHKPSKARYYYFPLFMSTEEIS